MESTVGGEVVTVHGGESRLRIGTEPDGSEPSVRQRTAGGGSHEVWRHPDGGMVIVPGGGHGNRDVPAGTLGAIRRATGIEELR
jgi:predicted RNA binding protein YcfA (HicA-like mRNA interferase family)